MGPGSSGNLFVELIFREQRFFYSQVQKRTINEHGHFSRYQVADHCNHLSKKKMAHKDTVRFVIVVAVRMETNGTKDCCIMDQMRVIGMVNKSRAMVFIKPFSLKIKMH